jgi:hypothetical protein
LSNGHDAEVNGDAPQQRQTRTIDFAAAGYVNVWTTSVVAKDCYLALIGKRIRCSFSKGKGALQRTVLEGEVVRNLGAIATRDATSPNAVAGQKIHRDTANSNTHALFQVELLLDKKMLVYFLLLKRTDEDVNLSQLKESAQRSYQLEERIGALTKRLSSSHYYTRPYQFGNGREVGCAEASAVQALSQVDEKDAHCCQERGRQ